MKPTGNEMQIFYRDADELVPYARNAKKHPKRQVDNIAKSLLENGWRCPVLIHAGTGEIIAGHGRLLAAQEARKQRPELGRVPCIDGSDMTPEQIRKYRILDNKLNESDWDGDMLALECVDLDFSEFDDIAFDFYSDSEDLGTDFELADGEKNPFQQMVFTLSDEQAEIIRSALDSVDISHTETYGNKNKNGNRLFEVVKQWAEQKTLS